LLSVLAGVMCAFGTFVLRLGVVAAIAQWIDGGDGYLVHDWGRVHAAGPIAAVCAVLFVSYLFGGYAAGRMARRAGLRHGVLVALFGVAISVGAVFLAHWIADSSTAIITDLRSLGM